MITTKIAANYRDNQKPVKNPPIPPFPSGKKRRHKGDKWDINETYGTLPTEKAQLKLRVKSPGKCRGNSTWRTYPAYDLRDLRAIRI